MKLNSLIKKLRKIEKEHGNIDVFLEHHDHEKNQTEELFLNEVCPVEGEGWDEEKQEPNGVSEYHVSLSNFSWEEEEKWENERNKTFQERHEEYLLESKNISEWEKKHVQQEIE